MTEDYSQPFCIIGSKGRFHPRYGAYLPPIEPAEEAESEEFGVAPGISSYRAVSKYEIEQLKATDNYLEGKINNLEERLKRKKKGAW